MELTKHKLNQPLWNDGLVLIKSSIFDSLNRQFDNWIHR